MGNSDHNGQYSHRQHHVVCKVNRRTLESGGDCLGVHFAIISRPQAET
jgi:hypothetical protein